MSQKRFFLHFSCSRCAVPNRSAILWKDNLKPPWKSRRRKDLRNQESKQLKNSMKHRLNRKRRQMLLLFRQFRHKQIQEDIFFSHFFSFAIQRKNVFKFIQVGVCDENFYAIIR